MPDEIQDAEFKDVAPTSPQVSTPPILEATAPVINGQTVDQVRYLDYEDIRVVFDAKTGAVIGAIPVPKGKKKVKNA